MPIQSRCPSCSAAVPAGAAWCSLCHADLRPRREAPVSRPVDDVLPSGDAAPAVSTRTRLLAPEPVGRREAGRHARTPEPVGRREAGRRAAPTRTLDPTVELDLPQGPVAPEELDEIAEQMLAQLAVAERNQRRVDIDDVPGGKWMVAAVGGVVVLVVLLSVFAIIGAVLSR